MRAALLADRGVLRLLGDAARSFLDGLVTAEVADLAPNTARFAALLTPQGKIIADFLVVAAPEQDGGGLLLDCPRALAATLRERLDFYKLRAKVTIEDLSDTLAVLASFEPGAATEIGLSYADPRLPALGWRAILPPSLAAEAAADLGAELVEAEAYERHRIAQAVPRGGLDFAYGDAFPHETDMDQLGGVDFDKGCYVGQEVVSRMQHRGTARSRIVAVSFDGAPPEPGAPVLAGERQVGTMGSGATAAPGEASAHGRGQGRGQGLALLRLDRVAEARAAGLALTAGGITVEPSLPAWARFAIPAG